MTWRALGRHIFLTYKDTQIIRIWNGLQHCRTRVQTTRSHQKIPCFSHFLRIQYRRSEEVSASQNEMPTPPGNGKHAYGVQSRAYKEWFQWFLITTITPHEHFSSLHSITIHSRAVHKVDFSVRITSQ